MKILQIFHELPAEGRSGPTPAGSVLYASQVEAVGIKQTFARNGISRQVELVQLVLSLADIPRHHPGRAARTAPPLGGVQTFAGLRGGFAAHAPNRRPGLACPREERGRREARRGAIVRTGSDGGAAMAGRVCILANRRNGALYTGVHRRPGAKGPPAQGRRGSAFARKHGLTKPAGLGRKG